jgi:hypothetical protein
MTWACFLHEQKHRLPYGDPMLGSGPEERLRNLDLMARRRYEKGPRPEQFGLPADYYSRYFVGGRRRKLGDPVWPPFHWR